MAASTAAYVSHAAPSLDFDAVPGSYNHLMTAIHRHSDGLIWVGTSTGLCRYDGYSITPAPTALTDSATILSDYILDISEDSKGRLWLKTESRYGLYDPYTHSIQEDLSEILSEAGISGSIIEIEPDPDRSMWISTDNGVFRIPPDGKKADGVSDIPENGLNISDIKVKEGSVICVDESGALIWIDPV